MDWGVEIISSKLKKKEEKDEFLHQCFIIVIIIIIIYVLIFRSKIVEQNGGSSHIYQMVLTNSEDKPLDFYAISTATSIKTCIFVRAG